MNEEEHVPPTGTPAAAADAEKTPVETLMAPGRSRNPPGVNSSISSFGLSVGLAVGGAVLLAALSISFSNQANASTVLSPAEKDHVADVLEHSAQVMSDAQLKQQIADEPPATQTEILRINEEARPRSLQVALLIPLLVALLGFGLSFRMMALPDPASSEGAELAALG
jgi:hypothetical protein